MVPVITKLSFFSHARLRNLLKITLVRAKIQPLLTSSYERCRPLICTLMTSRFLLTSLARTPSSNASTTQALRLIAPNDIKP